MTITTDSRIRNKMARESINRIAKDNGMRFTFIASLLGVEVSSFNHWRGNKYDYSTANLKKVEAIIEKYTFED